MANTQPAVPTEIGAKVAILRDSQSIGYEGGSTERHRRQGPSPSGDKVHDGEGRAQSGSRAGGRQKLSFVKDKIYWSGKEQLWDKTPTQHG